MTHSKMDMIIASDLLTSEDVKAASAVEADNAFAAEAARRGARMIEEGRFKEAEEILRQGLERCVGHQDCMAHLAVCLAGGRRKFVSAEKIAKSMIRTNPYEARGYYALGRVNLLGSRRGSAFRNLEKAKAMAEGDDRLEGTLKKLDPRRPPVLSWLPRNNFLNIWLGRWRARLAK